MRRLLLLGMLLLLCGCQADPKDALRALSSTSLTDVRLGGYPFFLCGDSDQFNTAFTARDPKGRLVEGAVCCGLWKACTVRIR